MCPEKLFRPCFGGLEAFRLRHRGGKKTQAIVAYIQIRNLEHSKTLGQAGRMLRKLYKGAAGLNHADCGTRLALAKQLMPPYQLDCPWGLLLGACSCSSKRNRSCCRSGRSSSCCGHIHSDGLGRQPRTGIEDLLPSAGNPSNTLGPRNVLTACIDHANLRASGGIGASPIPSCTDMIPPLSNSVRCHTFSSSIRLRGWQPPPKAKPAAPKEQQWDLGWKRVLLKSADSF